MAKLYIKNTDGTFTPYSPIAVTNLDIVQGKGNSLTSAMSQKSVSDELAKKQDVITDLATIRTNAEKGATALQSYTETDPVYMADKPSIALKTEIASKQDTISDLDAIRQGAAKGSTALQSESDPVYLADKPKIALKVEIPDVSGKADKATTLAGYGIADAYTKSEVDAAISSAITTTLNTEV